ncbi:hypothetical protein M9458_010242, partial [Cirrhinus mrigala]
MKLEIHYSIYKDSLHAFSVELATARQTFFSNLKNSNSNYTLTLFANVERLTLKSRTGEVITDQEKQLRRWVEHYIELYAIQSKALKSGKLALLQPLHKLLCLCRDQGPIPQYMRDANIATVCKNKGDHSDCNNYRGISLLNIVGKAFARVILVRLQILASHIYPESQCGFRAGQSTIDMIFSLRQLQEKCREQQMPLYVAFIDLTKAFDLVSRSGLFRLLQKISCPPNL